MYKRWQGNTGEVRQVEERSAPPPPPRPAPSPPPRSPGHAPTPPLSGLPFLGRLEGVLGALETEDLLLIAILYLLYRESGDVEMLLILGVLFVV